MSLVSLQKTIEGKCPRQEGAVHSEHPRHQRGFVAPKEESPHICFPLDRSSQDEASLQLHNEVAEKRSPGLEDTKKTAQSEQYHWPWLTVAGKFFFSCVLTGTVNIVSIEGHGFPYCVGFAIALTLVLDLLSLEVTLAGIVAASNDSSGLTVVAFTFLDHVDINVS